MFTSALLAASLLTAQAKPSVRIGNFLVSAPNGISVIYCDRTAVVIDFGGEYVVGTAAPDDSYHSQSLTLNQASVLLEWGRLGDGVVGRLRSNAAHTIDVHFRTDLWPKFAMGYRQIQPYLIDSTVFRGIMASAWTSVSFEFERGLSKGSGDAYELALPSSESVHFAIDQTLDPKQIDAQLDNAKAAYLKRRPTARRASGATSLAPSPTT